MSPLSDPIEIRPMTPHDAEPAAGLSGELGYPVDCDVMRARIARIAARPDHAVFVACRGPFVVGWIHVAAVEHLQSEPRAEIGGLVVTAEARSSGVGALLVTRAEEWAREHGLGGVIVRSQVMREAAHRFYLREGFERTKTSAVFSKML